MKAPSYYPSFACIAARCTHSCCVGWQITLDEAALSRYQALPGALGTQLRASIERNEDGEACFRLGEEARCPHLREDGLCQLICSLGEEGLCDICREHPRFYTVTARGMEVGLGAACEEACRLILSSDEYGTFVELPCTDEDEACERPLFDAIAHRERIYGFLRDRTQPFTRRLRRIGDAYGIDLSAAGDDAHCACLASLEYLTEAHRALFASSFRTGATLCDAEQRLAERFFAYLLLRHLSGTVDEADARLAIGLCLFCVTLFSSLLSVQGVDDAMPAARMISEELEYSEDNTDSIRFHVAATCFVNNYVQKGDLK